MRTSLLVAGLLLVGCDDAPAPSLARPSVEITDAYLVDHGGWVAGTIKARVTGPTAEESSVTLWAGAMPERSTGLYCEGSFDSGPCRYVGWLLDLPEGSEQVDLGPGETREVNLTVRSGNRPALNSSAAVAMCGETVTIVLVPTNDGAQGGAFDIDYRCDLSALRKR